VNNPAGYRLIDVPRERQPQQLEVNEWGFAMAVPASGRETMATVLPWDRARGVEVADASRGTVGDLAAFHASHAFQMRVPGGASIPVSGLTWVSVHPGHRRRGLLRAMITEHFERSLARGETVSALYAAETKIYQRFGYGHAGFVARVDVGRTPDMRAIEGASDLNVRLENADIDKHAEVIRAVQRRMTRPGTITEFDDPMRNDFFVDIPEWRDGHEQLRFAWVDDADGPAAFALFARKGKWEGATPDGEVEVHTWGAATSAAMQRLFSVVADLDLMSKCWVNRVPLDSALFHMLEDPRSLKPAIQDNLWVRVLDVPGALAARGYAADADLTVAVTDAMMPANAGTWRLVAKGGEQTATVTKVEGGDTADVTLDIQELSAAYLGGVGLHTLASAGLVTENRVGAVDAMSRAFTASEQAASNLGF
jgi:predicted acetyltransferase